MKIVCQSCNSAFNVDDAKIPKGKKVGVKCKSCGAVIVILPDGGLQGGSSSGEEHAAPEAAPPPPPKPAPKPAPAAPKPPPAEDPFGGSDDPFAGLSEDSLEVEGAAPAPPEEFETEAPPEPDTGPEFDEPEPPKPKAPPPPMSGAGAVNDPFAEDSSDSGPQFAGATEFSSGGGVSQDSDGNFSFDDAGGGDALDELDAIDKQVEREVKAKKAAPAAPAKAATIGLDADAFYDPVSVAAGNYTIRNAKGQVAGPMPIAKVKELLKSKKIGAKDEISRNEGPWLSVKMLLETNVENTDLEKFLATASAEKAGAMSGGFSFDEEAMGKSGLGGGKLSGKISLIIKVALGLLLLSLAAGGGYWWYASREVELSQLTTPKLKELVMSRQSVTSSREELSKQAYQKAEAIIRALLVEQFPDAEKELKVAIQKNPSNFRAAALMARLYAHWSEMLGEKARAQDATALAEAVKAVEPTADYALVALAHVNRVAGKIDPAVAAAQNATTISPNSAETQAALAFALASQPGQLTEAQAAVEKALAAGAEDQLALLVLAKIRELDRDFAGAAAAYDRAIAARQNAVYPRLLKARFILKNDPAKVSEALELLKAVEGAPLGNVKPFKSRVLVTRADALLAGGQYGEALQKAKEADGVFPSAETKTAVGDALFAAGQVSEALISYQAATAADRTYQPALQRLGKAQIAIGETDKGEASLREAVKLDPGDLTGRVLLGQAFARTKKVEEAQKEFEAVIGIDPRNADAYVSLGQLQLTQGNNQDALASFDKAIELDPQNPDTYIAIGKTFWELGDNTSAISRTRKAVELAPLRLASHHQLARFLWDTGDFAAAMTAYDQAIQLLKEGDQNPYLFTERGIVKFYLKDYDGALADIVKAYEIRKSEPQVYFWNGRIRLAKALQLIASGAASTAPAVEGELQAAQGEFSKAEFYARQNPMIAHWWGEAWVELRQYASALQQYDGAIAKAKETEKAGWIPYLDPEISKARLYVRQEKWRDAYTQYGNILPKVEAEEERVKNLKTYRLVPESAGIFEQLMDWHPRRWPQWEADRLKHLYEVRTEATCGMGFVEKDELDKSAQAEQTLAKCLALKPDLAKAHLYRCQISMDRSAYKEGLGRCQQAVRYDPNLGEAYVQIGYVMVYENNDPDGAVQNWYKALRKNSGLGDKRRKDIISEIRSQGEPDASIRRRLGTMGYSSKEIDALDVR